MTAELLLLCPRLPFPPNKGDRIRSHALLAHLAQHYKVHVGCFIQKDTDPEHLATVQRLAEGECFFLTESKLQLVRRALPALLFGQPVSAAHWYSKHMANWVDGIAGRASQAVVFSSAMAPYLLDNPKWNLSQCLLDMVDVDSDKWRQYSLAARGIKRWLFAREATRLLRLEQQAAQRFGATTLVSPQEAKDFAALAPESADRIHAAANGVDGIRFSPEVQHPNPFKAEETPIVMTGAMDYFPNVDGAEWFIRQVMPLVRRELPQARFYAVGAHPPASLKALASESVAITGSVPDVRPYIQHAEAVVAPLHIARGVQNKVLEAMAMARPVVATHEATRALNACAGRELWIENDPARFAAAVIEAAQSNNRSIIAHNGQRYVERYHRWPDTLAPLSDLLTALAGSTPSRHFTILYHYRTRSCDGQALHREELVSALRQLGHTVIMAGPKQIDPMEASAGKAILPAWLHECLEMAYNLTECVRLALAVRQHRPDAIYARANVFTLSATWMARLLHLPLLLEVNAPLAQERAAFGELALPSLAQWSERRAWTKADYALPVSSVLADTLKAAGVDASRIEVMPNGVDTARFQPTDINACKKQLGLDHRLVLGFTGFIREWHELEQVIELMAADTHLKDACLLIAGDGPARESIEKLARQRDIASRVIITGVLRRDEVPLHIGAMDIALQPAATAYASPLKLFEYMAMARAIIAPGQPNIREILTHERDALLFPPNDTAALGQAIARLSANADLRAKLGAQAARTIEERHYAWQHNARRISAIMEQLVCGPSAEIADEQRPEEIGQRQRKALP